MIRIVTIGVIHNGPISDIAYAFTEETYVENFSVNLDDFAPDAIPAKSTTMDLRRAFITSVKIVCDNAEDYPPGYAAVEIYLLPRDHTSAKASTLLASVTMWNSPHFLHKRKQFVKEVLDRHFKGVETDVERHL